MPYWRIAKNKWNLAAAPWTDAVGIEEVDDDLAVPGLIAWFTRPGLENANEVVANHNKYIDERES